MLHLTPLLQVFDMQTSVAFYRDVLGFEVVQTFGPGTDYTWAMLKLDQAVLMLNTAYDDGERPGLPDAARQAAHADTVLYIGCENADAFCTHLRAHGWPVREPVNTHYGMRQVYTHDPDGYEVCFQHPVESEV